MSTQPNSYYQIEALPQFPANLFKFKDYDGVRTVAALLLLMSFCFFFFGLLNIIESNLALPPLQIRTFWDIFISLGHSIFKIFDTILDLFNLILLATPFILSLLVSWIIFDPRNVANFALGITNILFGILGILNPADIIPDIFPIIGGIDDTFSGGLMVLGSFILFQAGKRREKTNNIIQLMNEHNEQEALQLLLEDQGIAIKKMTK